MEQDDEAIQINYEDIFILLISLAREKKIITIQQFCDSLKEFDLSFSIYGNKNPQSNIYCYLGEISQECIDEKIPNITTLIDFKNKLKPFYRLVDTTGMNDDEEKEFLKKYDKNEAKKILDEERQKVFAFDWSGWLKDEKFADFEDNDLSLEQENLKILAQAENDEKDSVKREITVEVRITLPVQLEREILQRANNRCENQNCKNPQPFIDKKGEIFLEIHHKIPYSECKKHTLENCIALCPNCHRREHYGAI
jgi:hypothetical protein